MDSQEDNLHREPRGVKVIAAWLLLSVIPGVYWSLRMGDGIVLSHLAVIVWAYNSVAFLCSLGLFFRKEWARKGAVWLFSVYFIWAVVAVHLFLGPAMDALSFWLTGYVSLSQAGVQKILFVLFIVYILWPVLVVLYLTYPGVKISFFDKSLKMKKGRGVRDG